MKNLFFFFVLILASVVSRAQEGSRSSIAIPDVDGYKVLKADLHMHSVFSDGLVWPSFRVDEAWHEGLDVIAITEHIEYRPNKDDVRGDHNRAYAIAREEAEKLGILVIPGSEITRRMPPGHFNALFVNDANKLEVPDWMDAFREARRQGAFIFWNHPGWKAQQPDSACWLPEHQMLFDSGYMDGIEVVNYNEWYPSVLTWALERNLTMLGNSDIHGAIYQQYPIHNGAHRPMTLIFSTEKSLPAVKEALLNRRTVVFFDNMLMGTDDWLSLLFRSAVQVNPWPLSAGESKLTMVLENRSDFPIMLQPTPQSIAMGIIYPVALNARSQALLTLNLNNRIAKMTGNPKVPMRVEGWHVAADKELLVEIEFRK